MKNNCPTFIIAIFLFNVWACASTPPAAQPAPKAPMAVDNDFMYSQPYTKPSPSNKKDEQDFYKMLEYYNN